MSSLSPRRPRRPSSLSRLPAARPPPTEPLPPPPTPLNSDHPSTRSGGEEGSTEHVRKVASLARVAGGVPPLQPSKRPSLPAVHTSSSQHAHPPRRSAPPTPNPSHHTLSPPPPDRPPRTRSKAMLSQALELAKTAVELDKSETFPEALEVYREAVTILELVADRLEAEERLRAERGEEPDAIDDEQVMRLAKRAKELRTVRHIHDTYSDRIRLLEIIVKPTHSVPSSPQIARHTFATSVTSPTPSRTPARAEAENDAAAVIGSAMMEFDSATSPRGSAFSSRTPTPTMPASLNGHRPAPPTSAEALPPPPPPKDPVSPFDPGMQLHQQQQYHPPALPRHNLMDHRLISAGEPALPALPETAGLVGTAAAAQRARQLLVSPSVREGTISQRRQSQMERPNGTPPPALRYSRPSLSSSSPTSTLTISRAASDETLRTTSPSRTVTHAPSSFFRNNPTPGGRMRALSNPARRPSLRGSISSPLPVGAPPPVPTFRSLRTPNDAERALPPPATGLLWTPFTPSFVALTPALDAPAGLFVHPIGLGQGLDAPLHAPAAYGPPPSPAFRRPFHLMRQLRASMLAGGYLTRRLYISAEMWRAGGAVKLDYLDVKVRTLEAVLVGLHEVERAGERLLREGKEGEEPTSLRMEQAAGHFARVLAEFCAGLDDAQDQIAKKLGYETVKGRKAGSMGVWTSKMARSLGVSHHHGRKDDSLPAYVYTLTRVFQAAQTLDQHLVSLHPPASSPSSYARLPPDTRAQIDARLRRAADFFGSVVCRFVLADLDVLMKRWMKKVSGFGVD